VRTNLPITTSEYSLPAGQTLVSVTDLKGRITYCNPAFITVSGFSRDELLGQPHNIVRHPDMPEEAFRDMWATIQAGLPWTGLVKNRRKDGAFYWVRANATPMKQGDRITGYLSVRSAPTRGEVQATTALYARMQEQARAGRQVLTLERGRVVRRDVLGRCLAALTPGQRGRLFGLQVLALGLCGAAFATLPVAAAALVSMGLAVGSAALMHALLMRPFDRVLSAALYLSAGDLTHAIEGDLRGVAGELQLALNQLALNMRTVVADVRDEIEQVSSAVHEISAGNQDLSSRTESQASSLEETAASMEQINGTVQQSAASASAGAGLASEMASMAERSHAAVQASADAMEQITQSSLRMAEIIRTIEGVAFQTNILALNAAVEAARAGESGRGFAVVASEVRALAHRTTEAAREIKQLIEESGERVAAGNAQSREARDRMAQAMQSVNRVGTLLGEISNSAKEQTMGISQVNEAVTHLDSVTQQNAAMVEEMAASSQQLNGQVEAVLNSLRLFRLGDRDVTVAQIDAVQLRRGAKASAAPAPALPARTTAAPPAPTQAPAALSSEEAWTSF
jgi:aerotaxis receptor